MSLRYISLMLIGLLNLRFLSMCPSNTFRDVNGNCTDCPAGFTDPNCSTTCPKGLYGFGCRHLCTCAGCDPISGCPSTSTEADRITTSPFSKDVTSIIFQPDVHLILLIVVLLIVAGNLAVSVFKRCTSQKLFNRPGHEGKAKRESTDLGGTIEETDLNQGAYESPIIPTERPDIRVYMEKN